LFGPGTNRDFLISVLRQDAFVNGSATTAFIGETDLSGGADERTLSAFQRLAAAAVLDFRASAARAHAASVAISPGLINWSSTGRLGSILSVDTGSGPANLVVTAAGSAYSVSDGDDACSVQVRFDDGTSAEISIDDTSHRVLYCTPTEGVTWLSIDGNSGCYLNSLAGRPVEDGAAGSGRILAPMHGQLLELFVEKGQQVTKGQRLLVLEAMKMQHEILADVEGLVLEVNAEVGNQVAADALIIEIEPAES
jgi:geranyl-CoA carboxylase alpha subunit